MPLRRREGLKVRLFAYGHNESRRDYDGRRDATQCSLCQLWALRWRGQFRRTLTGSNDRTDGEPLPCVQHASPPADSGLCIPRSAGHFSVQLSSVLSLFSSRAGMLILQSFFICAYGAGAGAFGVKLRRRKIGASVGANIGGRRCSHRREFNFKDGVETIALLYGPPLGVVTGGFLERHWGLYLRSRGQEPVALAIDPGPRHTRTTGNARRS